MSLMWARYGKGNFGCPDSSHKTTNTARHHTFCSLLQPSGIGSLRFGHIHPLGPCLLLNLTWLFQPRELNHRFLQVPFIILISLPQRFTLEPPKQGYNERNSGNRPADHRRGNPKTIHVKVGAIECVALEIDIGSGNTER